MQDPRLLPVVSLVHRHSNPRACTDKKCKLGEGCITNYSISRIFSSRVAVFHGPCCHSNRCVMLDPEDRIANFSTLCELTQDLNRQLETTSMGKGIIIVVADMILDKNGILNESQTKCDVLFVLGNSHVQRLVPFFDNKSIAFDIFSKMMKKQITKKTIQYMKRASIQAFCLDKDDDNKQIQRHNDLRETQFISKMTKLKLDPEHIVDESRASIFHCWEGKSCKKRPRYLELPKDTRMELPEAVYDTAKALESGPNQVIYREGQSGECVVCILLQHKVNFTHEPGDYFHFVSSDHSMQLRKYYPRNNYHCTWDNIPREKYAACFPETRFSLKNTLTIHMPMSIPSERKRLNEEYMIQRPSVFGVEIPSIFKMFTPECEILDCAQNMEKVPTAWKEVKYTSESEKYLLSMFFPDEMANSLKVSIDKQLERQKEDDKKAVKLKLSIENCKRPDESEFYNSSTYSLFVGINPTLNNVQCMCTDLVLGMILISNGMFCHRENVCQLMYMAKYMDTVFQLDSSDEMPPYLYLNHTMPGHIRTCYADVRIMHKNTRKILISEYISDVMNEVFYGGSMMTHDGDCKGDIHLKVDKSNALLFQREIRHRLGRDLVYSSFQDLKLAANVLTRQTGIYKQDIDQDSRIYNLRNITATMRTQDAITLLSTQNIIRWFASVSKKNKTFMRTGYVDGSMKYKRSAFQFLEDFKNHMDSDILKMIKIKRCAIAILDKEIEDEINQILTVNIP